MGEWVKAIEKAPPNYDDVLGYYEGLRAAHVVYRKHGGEWVFPYCENEAPEPDYWMRMPKGPQSR